MQEVWEKQVLPDFAMWQATASSRQRPAHIHTGRAAHVLESIGSEDEAACVAEVRHRVAWRRCNVRVLGMSRIVACTHAWAS